MPLSVGGRPVPPVAIIAGQYAALAVASVLVTWLVTR
jgi:fumarate reductase subunit C